MKRKLLNTKFLRQTALAVPAAALMLGAAHAGTTVGLNVRTWTYADGGAGYQTTGFPVTAKAFGVDVANWTSPAPFYAYAAVSASVVMGSITAQLEAVNPWQSGIGQLNAGWVPETVTPGDNEVTWGMLDNTGWSVGLSGLNTAFPNGYVIQNIAAGKITSTSHVEFTDGTTFTNSIGFSPIYTVPGANGSGSVGLQVTPTLKVDAISMINPTRPDTNNCALAGFIITDQPVVSQKPVGGNYNSGATISLSAGAIGVGSLSYQWRHNGAPISGATGTAYTKAGASTSDSGSYDLVVTNLHGSGTSVVAVVDVIATPTILTDVPAAATNFVGLNSGFFVIAGGATPLHYQWQHAGTNLSGATDSSLLLNEVQASQAGNYRVIVTNTLGATTSSVVALTLVAGPPYEGFNYADGDIAGQNGGTGWAGPWSQSWPTNGANAVASPGDTYQDAVGNLVVTGSKLQLGASGIADFGSDRKLGAMVGGAGTVYISFLGAFPTGGWEGIDLLQGTTVSCFLGQGWSGEPWGCGSFPYPEILTSKPSTVLSYLVYRFDYTATNTQVRIYVNPTLASEPTAADATGTLGLFQFDTVRIKAHALSAGTLDEFRIAGSWAAASPYTARTDPPVIVQDLSAVDYAYVGGNATMSIVAGGAPTLHYAWKKGTSPVGTDSPTLTLTGLTAGSSGSYSVAINNSYGSTNSVTCLLTVAASPDLYTSQVLPDAPGAYWPLSETVAATAYDYSSGKHGTQNGGLTLGVAGPRPPAYQGFSAGALAYEFDGWSGYIDCGTAPSLSGTTDFTLEAWINTTNQATGMIVQQRYAGGYNGEYMFTVNGNGTVGFTVYGGGASQYSFSSAAASTRVNDGKWHHVAAVRSGTNGFIYVDGSLAASRSGAAVAPLDPTFTTVIGRDQRGANSYFNGKMADVAIYTHALSATRIATHASTGVLAGSPLVLSMTSGGWVEDSKPVGQAQDGLNLGISWVATSTDAVPVTRTGVAKFSSGAQLAVPANPDFNSPTGTICFWMRTGVPAAGTGSMLFDRRTGEGLVMVLNGVPSGGIDVQYTGNASFAAGGYVLDDNWHHVALTYDQSASGTVSVYVDGNLTGSQANTAAWSWPASQQIEFARSHDTYWQEYNGQMDDFRIYSRELTPAEILTIGTPATSDTLVDTAALKVRYNFGTAAGVGTSLKWTIGALESSPTVGPAVWTPIGTTTPSYPFLPPYAVTNSSLFYRLGL